MQPLGNLERPVSVVGLPQVFLLSFLPTSPDEDAPLYPLLSAWGHRREKRILIHKSWFMISSEPSISGGYRHANE